MCMCLHVHVWAHEGLLSGCFKYCFLNRLRCRTRWIANQHMANLQNKQARPTAPRPSSVNLWKQGFIRKPPRHHRDTTGTPPGHHQDTTGTPPGHHRDTTRNPPGHHRDTTGTPPGHHWDTTGATARRAAAGGGAGNGSGAGARYPKAPRAELRTHARHEHGTRFPGFGEDHKGSHSPNLRSFTISSARLIQDA